MKQMNEARSKKKTIEKTHRTTKPIETNGFSDDLTSGDSYTYREISDRKYIDRSVKVSDSNMNIFKPTSYHGPRFAERKPLFTSDLIDRTITQGCRMKLTCSVIGEDNMEISWLKNGNPILDYSRYSMEYFNNVATLEILNTSIGDSAEYTCIAKNDHGVSSSTARLNVVESFNPTPIPPIFTRPIREHYRISKDELSLECKIRCQPAPSVRWFKNGEEMEDSNRLSQAFTADGIARLTIRNPAKADSARYICRAENSNWSDQVSYDVKFAGKDEHINKRSEQRKKTSTTTTSRTPYFSNVLTDTFVPVGGSMALQVEIKGSPVDITWYKESLKLPKASPRHRTFTERGVHTLLIPSISDYEAGKYTCRASNSYGTIESSAYVQTVHPASIRDGKPPMFASRPDKILNLATGEDVVVSFRVKGDPKPTGKIIDYIASLICLLSTQ